MLDLKELCAFNVKNPHPLTYWQRANLARIFVYKRPALIAYNENDSLEKCEDATKKYLLMLFTSKESSHFAMKYKTFANLIENFYKAYPLRTDANSNEIQQEETKS